MKYVSSILCAGLVALFLQLLADQARTREVVRSFNDDGSLGTSIRGRTIAGSARVIDGDTLEIDGERVRLEGIDAPEIKQLCSAVLGRSWPAGKIAAITLERWVSDRQVHCKIVGRDGYGRSLGRCTTDDRNLNSAMIERGLAWAFVKYSHAYVRQERGARSAGLGVWAASCQTAWDYRANRWSDVAGKAPAGCAIKGNITRRGRIYHMPWSPWYGRTRIEPNKGERWFCNERQALAAGWRPAQVR